MCSRSAKILKMVKDKGSNETATSQQVVSLPSEILKVISENALPQNELQENINTVQSLENNFPTTSGVFDKIFEEMCDFQQIDQHLNLEDCITSTKTGVGSGSTSFVEIMDNVTVIESEEMMLLPNDTVSTDNAILMDINYCEEKTESHDISNFEDDRHNAENHENITAIENHNQEVHCEGTENMLPIENNPVPTVENSTKNQCRWKRAAPEEWARNVCKQKRNKCEEYVTKKGVQKAKCAQAVDCSNCRFHCNKNFTEVERSLLCKTYWALDYSRKKDFLLKFVTQSEPQRRRVRTESGKGRALSRAYYFQKDSNNIRVCQTFFIKTLNITDGPIIHAFKNINDSGVFNKPDQRGKKTSINKTPDVDVRRVKRHIEKFPTVESHYTRKSNSRLYLDPGLSISKMYELYTDECKVDNVTPVGSTTYRRIFCKNYNYSFFHPKKDQCLTCTNYNSATPENKLLLENEYRAHKERENAANTAKAVDKERSEKEQEFMCATFDLQSVLQIPSAETSQLYYTRKLCVYNLCVYESKSPNKGYCIAWNELNGKRGSTEIGSAILWWLQQLPSTIKEITLFSDTCGGQNRNQHIAGLFLYAVQTLNFDVIEHKFLESGHSYMEVDSMHSAIEKQKKNLPVYSMIDWMNIFRTARSSRKRKDAKPYEAKELKFEDMVDLKDLSAVLMKNRKKDENGAEVAWLRIKCLKYEKALPNIIQYRYDYNGPYTKINTLQAKGKAVVIPETKLKKAYTKMLPISKEKKNDLERMCKLKIIPTELHGWYQKLPTSKSAVNSAPLPGSESDDSDN